MFLTNYHTHSLFCDGKAAPEEYVQAALENGFQVLGFSGHAPVPFENHFAILPERLEDYCKEVEQLKEKYNGRIEIYLSLEKDYIPGITTSFKELAERCRLDYTMGSVHLVKGKSDTELWFIDGPKTEIYDQGLEACFGGEIQAGIKAYYAQIREMVETQNPDVIGHMDKIKMHNQGRYFKENEDWYMGELEATLDLIRQKDSIVEINTRGIYKKRSESLFPGDAVIEMMHQRGIPVMVNSDAHQPHELPLGLERAYAAIQNAGYRKVRIFRKGQWEDVSID